LGLCDLVIERVRATRPHQLEFHAVLRRLPRGRSPQLDAELRAKGKQRTNDSPDRFRKPPMPTTFELSRREQQLVERKRALVAAARRIVRRR
jgi:hypothetical protein